MANRTEAQQKTATRKHYIGCLIHNTFENYAGTRAYIGHDEGDISPLDANIIIRAKAGNMCINSKTGRAWLSLTKVGARLHANNSQLYDRTYTHILSEYTRYGGASMGEDDKVEVKYHLIYR